MLNNNNNRASIHLLLFALLLPHQILTRHQPIDEEEIKQNKGAIRGKGTAYFRELGKVTFFVEEEVEAFFIVNVTRVYDAFSKFIEYAEAKISPDFYSVYFRDDVLKINSMFKYLINSTNTFEGVPARLKVANRYQLHGGKINLDYIYRVNLPFDAFHSLDLFFNNATNFRIKENENNTLLSLYIKRILTDTEKFIDDFYQTLYKNKIPSTILPPLYFLKTLEHYGNISYIEFPYPLKETEHYQLYDLISTCNIYKDEHNFYFLINVPIKALSKGNERENDFYLYSITPTYVTYGNMSKILLLKNNYFVYNFRTEYYLTLRDLSSCDNVGKKRWSCKLFTNVIKYSDLTASCEALLFYEKELATKVCDYVIENRLIGLQMIRLRNKINCFTSDEMSNFNIHCNFLKQHESYNYSKINFSLMSISNIMRCFGINDGCYVTDDRDLYQFPNPLHRVAKKDNSLLESEKILITYKCLARGERIQNLYNCQKEREPRYEYKDFSSNDREKENDNQFIVFYSIISCVIFFVVMLFIILIRMYISLIEKITLLKKNYEENALSKKDYEENISKIKKMIGDNNAQVPRHSIPTMKPPPPPSSSTSHSTCSSSAPSNPLSFSPNIQKNNNNDDKNPEKIKRMHKSFSLYSNVINKDVDEDGYIICNQESKYINK